MIGILIAALASFVAELLWIAMVVLFLTGGVAYVVNAELGRKLLKRSLVMMVIFLLIHQIFPI